MKVGFKRLNLKCPDERYHPLPRRLPPLSAASSRQHKQEKGASKDNPYASQGQGRNFSLPPFLGLMISSKR